ncbi:MAG: hypothetical protein NMNS02_10620 [Nitrosomonas sp.]|nr:MAG: hypothetical protein NMNS02_10620 [Nitrosomonas sp.]
MDFRAVAVVDHAEHTVLCDDLTDTHIFAAHAPVKWRANLRSLSQPPGVFQCFFCSGQFCAHFGQLRDTLIERTGVALAQMFPFIARLCRFRLFACEQVMRFLDLRLCCATCKS